LANPIPKLKTVFDDKKVTDHHAIIPTGMHPGGLPLEEKRIYDLVARRFIAAFYPECKISNTTVLGKVGQVPFKATGKQIIEPGWKEVYANDVKEKKEGEEEERLLPHFEAGESGPHTPRIHQGKTSPPKAFTEATLLRAMETAGKQVDDEEMRELLKDNGIGRPSTRANIIETLFRRKYIEKKKKNIYATQTGIDLIDTIQTELLKSAELTGQWERKLRLIEKGEYAMDTFKDELIQMVTDLTKEVKTASYKFITIAPDPPPAPEEKEKKPPNKKAPKAAVAIEAMQCPKCKTHLLKKGHTAYGCANFRECGFKLPFEIFGKKLTDKQIADLLTKGKTTKIKGLKIPGSSEATEGKLVMEKDFNIGKE
jgi:DNA topoisomerase-3